METSVGSVLSPVVKIINNTKEELTNLSLCYSDNSNSSIEISSLSANSEVITTMGAIPSESSNDLILKYSHNGVLEEQVVYTNVLNTYLIKLTLKINCDNGVYSVSSIIEKDPVDNPIELSKATKKKCYKCFLIAGGIVLSATTLYILKNMKK